MDPDPELHHSRPLGGTEYSWYRAVPGGTGVTVLALLLSRPLPLPLLRSALDTLHSSHPLIRATLSAAPTPTLSIPPSSTVPLLSLPASAVADILARSPDPPFHALLEHEMNQNPWSADPEAPVFYATVYEVDEIRSFIALRFHTGICDRVAGVAMLKEMLALLGGGGEVPMQEGVYSAIEDLIPQKDKWKPFWVRGNDLLGYSLNSLRSSVFRFEDTEAERSSAVVRTVIGEEETRRLLEGFMADQGVIGEVQKSRLAESICGITASTTETALFFLESHIWNLDSAIHSFEADEDDH